MSTDMAVATVPLNLPYLSQLEGGLVYIQTLQVQVLNHMFLIVIDSGLSVKINKGYHKTFLLNFITRYYSQ